MNYRIFIIEDDDAICHSLEKHLQKWQINTAGVENFQNVLEETMAFNPHLILLDLTLPYFNGFYWCEQIRKISQVPLIFISSADDKLNHVMAMTLGADDYITKPFDMDVLEAKIFALLRRSYDFSIQLDLLEHEGLILTLSDMSVHYQGNKEILTRNEFRILELLLRHKNKVVSRYELMNHLWQSDEYIDDNTLTVNITRLRQTLNKLGAMNYIKTKKAVGYYV